MHDSMIRGTNVSSLPMSARSEASDVAPLCPQVANNHATARTLADRLGFIVGQLTGDARKGNTCTGGNPVVDTMSPPGVLAGETGKMLNDSHESVSQLIRLLGLPEGM